MKRRVALLAALCCAAIAAVAVAFPEPDAESPKQQRAVDVPALGELDPPAGDPNLVELLSGIDFVPSRPALDAQLGPTAEAQLIAIARTGSPIADPGVRIRAYRALALYATPTTESELIDAVSMSGHGGGTDTLDNLYLRAAMDSLATVAGPDGVVHISPHLNHASRDVRAAAARALATCGSAAAVQPLRARLLVEPEEQVKAAISKAIRVLDSD